VSGVRVVGVLWMTKIGLGKQLETPTYPTLVVSPRLREERKLRIFFLDDKKT
jgi:hypothetical protein